MSQRHQVFVISDSTGGTGERVLSAALAQFESADAEVRLWPSIRTIDEVEEVVRRAVPMRALLVHTLVNHELRDRIAGLGHAHGLRVVDVLGPAIDQLAQFFGSTPSERPGTQGVLDEAYFRRVAAMEFSVRADDGRSPALLREADIVLVGVSRTSKTPVSTYLAQKGYKVANVPLQTGIAPPDELFRLPRGRVYALTIDPRTLHAIRQTRIRQLGGPEAGDYSDMNRVLDELRDALVLFRENPEWPVIDVTGRAVEETASEILKQKSMLETES